MIPMKPEYTSTSYYRHDQKKVYKDLLLDDMSELSAWAVRKHSDLVGDVPLDSRGGDYGTASPAVRDGRNVIRLVSPTSCNEPNKDKGRGWGLATLFRDCGGADWSEYNRIAFDVYPDLPGFRTVALCIYLYNEGAVRMPNDMAREGLHFVNIINHQWNRVYWEIPELPRDKVKGISLQYRLQGNEPGACEEVLYDFADLRLQKVDADHTRGWLPEKGEICFSHTGYTPDSLKTAVAYGLSAECFELIRADDGLVCYEGAIRKADFHTGEYQVLDFSDFKQEGRYFIKAGSKITRPFGISADIWRGTIEKTLNFFFCERCGYAVPGIHDICHEDLKARHGELTRTMNGGWHDAGDLSQGLGNTAEASYAMLSLAMHAEKSDQDLYEKLIDEARWGVDWVLKSRFGDGYRATWLCADYWSANFEGDVDDLTFDASRSPGVNFLSASVEAAAARAFKDSDPAFALRNIKAAKEDFAFAEEDLADTSKPFAKYDELGIASSAVMAAIELYKATGDEAYLDKAEKFAEIIPLCQQSEYTGWDIPVRGFFYTNRSKDRIVHYPHRSNEQAPLVALSALHAVKPDQRWVSAVSLYAEYIKKIAEYTAPYYMIPASIYSLDEVYGDRRDPFGCPREDAIKQIKNGIKLSDKYYLRLFPVWYSFRGNSGVMLSSARAALACAEVLNDTELYEIVRRALEWHVGRNPFNQSLIWGEGYNYTPQYTPMCGDMVGSFPVGVEAQGNEDIPYYPHANCYNYKEVWVFPAARWLGIMDKLYDIK